MSVNKTFKLIGVLAGPFACFVVSSLVSTSSNSDVTGHMAGIATWMAIWWFTESVHLAVTALIPVLFLPVFGIADAKTVAKQYTDSIIFLFIGGFMIAFAIEKHGLHKRIALKILSVVGNKPSTILMGIMLSAYLISNWISNTATTIMLFGAVMALLAELDNHVHEGKRKFESAMLLGLAFAATIGGMATPVGTPPNLFFFKEYSKAFPESNDLNFLTWAKIGFPLSFSFLILTFFVLKTYFLKEITINLPRNFFKMELEKEGKINRDQKLIYFVFISCMLLWFTRDNLTIGQFQFMGWKNLFPKPDAIDDSCVAIAAAFFLFLFPSQKRKGESILMWEDASKIRYDIILMFGSGFALAYGFEQSGLSSWLAHSLTFFKGIPVFLLILSLCIIVTIISEFASNIASIQLCIPILIAIQKELEINPLLLMIPATFAASLGFMLPVATAANTIVFGTKKIMMKDMFRVGLILDIAGILLITTFVYFYFT